MTANNDGGGYHAQRSRQSTLSRCTEKHMVQTAQNRQQKNIVCIMYHDPAGRGHPIPRGGHPGEGQGEPYHAQRSFTHGVIQPRPAAVQNPIKGGEAQAEKTIKEAAA